MATETRRGVLTAPGPLLAILLLAIGAVAPLEGQSGFPSWQGREDELEAALREGEILTLEQIGRGVTDPHRASIEYDGQHVRAVWKPLPALRDNGVRESWAAEVAAYRLSRYLKIDRVPPTVVRKVRSQKGSMQLWVEEVSAFVDLEGQQPPLDVWPQEMARMHAFDLLIDNWDRNQGNFLVDEKWRLVWIDHSRALGFDPRSHAKKPSMPRRFDRTTIERLRTLDKPVLEDLIGDLVPHSTVRAVLRQRDRIIEEFEGSLELLGEYAYLP